ncbi:apolipoprotein N-acyltransferase [Micromonospora solifontis]|uniref:Apolipoprotein N-acyltransferase n=1 Tax=Micromonospora solifontis TaxID=2487138 RepID=A0ABX9WHD0_9ACTN|nr:apolipoprotein N-acyltransferase [Micromonospora sp. PPF5-17B]NES37307.1 apolipoprotein N-acyltransferase [Micromonospora solifontis]NES55429.1 apolipoprotein N-acyltransferase [Micromonospora sp. PPF5-6]RNL98548.1 apolipoprotein N-acyltransferase [Micromonospora solifontis]
MTTLDRNETRATDVAREGTPPRPLPLTAALPMAVVAGLALLAAFPPYGVWALAPVGVALLAAATHRRRLRAGAGLGFVAGVTLFAPLLEWTNLHTGYLPWLLLSLLQAAYLALLGAATAWVSPLVDRHRWWAWPAVTGLLWVGQEALRDRTPFGGFPWGRLAFSQDTSPLLRLAALGGAPLVTFAVALAGGLLVTIAWRDWRRPAGHWRPVAGLTAALAALLAAAGGVPAGVRGGGDTVTVAIVQGNVPRLGLDFNAQRQAVLNNHVDATLKLAEQVNAGTQRRPDLVVWPENSSDIDPLRNPGAGYRISQAADAVGAPILVGAVLLGPGEGQVRNAGLLWRPGSGPDLDQLYTKRHPVPFAEYIPLRRIARMVSAEVDRVRSDFVPGTRAGILDTGAVTLGDVICFEVAYDGLVRDTVTGGGQLLVVQTNNATFDVAEARQQLAMVRLRAVEHGRAALMASTVGVSGFVTPDGRVDGATGFNTAAVVVRQMRLGDGPTPATRAGVWPEVALAALAVAALAGAAVLRRRREVDPG